MRMVITSCIHDHNAAIPTSCSAQRESSWKTHLDTPYGQFWIGMHGIFARVAHHLHTSCTTYIGFTWLSACDLHMICIAFLTSIGSPYELHTSQRIRLFWHMITLNCKSTCAQLQRIRLFDIYELPTSLPTCLVFLTIDRLINRLLQLLWLHLS